MIDGWLAMATQGAAVLVMVFGDIGFDHPGRFGLDFDDLAKLAIVYVFAALYGAMRWAIAGYLPLAGVQLLPLALGLAFYLFELVT